MRAIAVAVLTLAVSCAVAGASTHDLRARVSPTPSSLTTRSWSPTIVVTESGRPAAARLTLTIRKRAERHSFRPRATRRGSYRARVVFPSDGRWSWTLAASRRTLARGAVTVSARLTFELPYDLAAASDGTLFVLDRSRVLALDPRTGRLRVHATLSGATELVALERLADNTLFVTDLPGNRVLRIDPSGRVAAVATVAAPADLVADGAGSTLWVASIADGVGVVRVDVATRRVQPFATPFQPHGIDRDASGDFIVHDGHAVSRIDGKTGVVSPFADVDAFKLLIAPDGRIYGVEGSPRGGRVVRIAPDGGVTIVAGTGALGPHRDGPALEVQILPTAVELASDGSLLVAQLRPIPAIRRIDLATGQMTTVARGRR